MSAVLAIVSKTRFKKTLALITMAICAALAVALFSGSSSSKNSNTAGKLIAAIDNAADSARSTVSSLLSQRSPGERAGGVLASLKVKRTELRHQRALPKVVRRRAVPPTPDKPNSDSAFFQVLTEPPVVTVANSTPVGGIVPNPGGDEIFTPPVIGPPSGPPVLPPLGPPSGPPINPPPTLPAVPEPSTWLLMLFGFGVIGHALRRGNPRAAVA